MSEIYTLILAAGEGKRMMSDTSKVLHKICNKPLIDYVIKAADQVTDQMPIVIVGHKKQQVMEHLAGRVMFAFQDEQLGTGHAVLQAKDIFSSRKGLLVIIGGDTPLISGETLKSAVNSHVDSGSCVTVITTMVDNPTGYGRIVKNEFGNIEKIVEQKDASCTELDIKEINSGMYIFDIEKLFDALSKIKNNNAQGEFYLTDTIEILIGEGEKASTYIVSDYREILGVNDRVQLVDAQKIMQKNINTYHMRNGVTIIDPDNTYIGDEVKIGKDTVIWPLVTLEGETEIGSNCTIRQNSLITNSKIGNGVDVLSSVITDSTVGSETTVGPFAYIRPNCTVGEHVKVGDFVELKNSTIGDKTKISHLTYVGDSDVGRGVNFGCGTVTVNYDGSSKFKTTIGDNAFIGCNTNLVSPVNVGSGAYIAAGSTITDDVPGGSLAIARERQVIKKEWKDKRKK